VAFEQAADGVDQGPEEIEEEEHGEGDREPEVLFGRDIDDPFFFPGSLLFGLEPRAFLAGTCGLAGDFDLLVRDEPGPGPGPRAFLRDPASAALSSSAGMAPGPNRWPAVLLAGLIIV
jgi:hypothetical protein